MTEENKDPKPLKLRLSSKPAEPEPENTSDSKTEEVKERSPEVKLNPPQEEPVEQQIEPVEIEPAEQKVESSQPESPIESAADLKTPIEEAQKNPTIDPFDKSEEVGEEPKVEEQPFSNATR